MVEKLVINFRYGKFPVAFLDNEIHGVPLAREDENAFPFRKTLTEYVDDGQYVFPQLEDSGT
jgi:hypothetical protein